MKQNLLKYGLVVLVMIASTGLLWAGPYIEVIHDTCVVERIDSLRVNVSVEQVVNACCDNEHSEKTGADKLCIGHSLGDIDLPYFKDIKKRVSTTAQWIFYIYKGENEGQFTKNKNAVLSFIWKMRLDVQNYKTYDSEFMNHEIQL